jgi:hypothetical protein
VPGAILTPRKEFPVATIIEYRDDAAPLNAYPYRIVSPTRSSPCCMAYMQQVGRSAIEGGWRFSYRRCAVCGYTVRHFYAPSLIAILEAARDLRMTMAELNLGAGPRKRRTRKEIDAEIAAAQALVPRSLRAAESAPSLLPRRRKLSPSPA